MDIASFLTPKSEVVWVSAEGTIAQALERMKPNGFGSVPILDEEGRYFGTLSTSDLIWYLIEAGDSWQNTARLTPLANIRRARKDVALHVAAGLPSLLSQIAIQSFVSVVDDCGIFLGIVRRRPIIEYFARVAALGRRSERARRPAVCRRTLRAT
jgi:predicted transcriptional regulator